ncbi:regulatory protein GemA [Brytella acorum]|uniref:Regulatory protein GemA n=1 Tax=Brytella acorum TaxID=2959299 RepID=A0AA35UQU0_9PROT|nr:regulatory protein GemA [Brytella acorum]MDF3623345.1 regulatory protein GemA [Brytella acorum]CAI9120424.1 regulatory protein GemA [Brytella acorum]
MPRKAKPLAPAKVRLVQVARKRLDLDEDTYRLVLMRTAGVASARDLSSDGFRRVMDEFGRLGFQSDSNRRNFGDRPGFATTGQVAAIRRQWHLYSEGTGTEAQLGKWLERTFKVSALRFLPEDEARKALIALKQMVARGTPVEDI